MSATAALIESIREEVGWLRLDGDTIDSHIAASLDRIADSLGKARGNHGDTCRPDPAHEGYWYCLPGCPEIPR